MKLDCRNFRAALELALAGEGRALSALAWHEHLLGCGECRALLAGEEALDLLLASLPDPRLPRRLTERVLVRLRAARRAEVQLDALLALDHAVAAPSGLATRVLAGLATERERVANENVHADSAEGRATHADASLERLLDESGHVEVRHDLAPRVLARLRASEAEAERKLDRVLDRAAAFDPVHAPQGLAPRVLASLAAERATVLPEHANTERTRSLSAANMLERGPRARRAFVWALAASVLFALALWSATWIGGERDETPIVQPPERGPRPPSAPENGANDANAPSAEMLAALDVLEQWDLLMQSDVDVLLSTFAPADQALLDLHAFDDTNAPSEESSGDGSKSGPKPSANKSEERKG